MPRSWKHRLGEIMLQSNSQRPLQNNNLTDFFLQTSQTSQTCLVYSSLISLLQPHRPDIPCQPHRTLFYIISTSGPHRTFLKAGTKLPSPLLPHFPPSTQIHNLALQHPRREASSEVSCTARAPPCCSSPDEQLSRVQPRLPPASANAAHSWRPCLLAKQSTQ